MALPGMNQTAQARLANARVALLGINGAGSACATYLASSGIGEIILIDDAAVAEGDLYDQPLFQRADIGRSKTMSAAKRLAEIEPELKVQSVSKSLDSHNAEQLIDSAHIVVDGLNDWQQKLLLSDVCMHMGRTLVHAGVRKFEFQIYTMIPGRSACLRCAFSKAGLEDITASGQDDSPAALGPVAGMAGAFQAIEVIKILSGLGPTPGNHLIKFDSLRRDFDDITNLGPRMDCPDCGLRY
jgi:molybdopterin/thiamine biosynthesis adenylyltransferase